MAAGSESLDYGTIMGIQSIYEARLPIPTACLDSISAAFYLYDRNGNGDDKIYLMSHGYIWA